MKPAQMIGAAVALALLLAVGIRLSLKTPVPEVAPLAEVGPGRPAPIPEAVPPSARFPVGDKGPTPLTPDPPTGGDGLPAGSISPEERALLDEALDRGDGEAVPDRSIWPVTSDGIQGAINESIGGISECYTGWLEQNPELQGKIVLQFDLAPTSEGEDMEIVGVDVGDSTVGHLFMEGCVASVVEELRFEGNEATSVSYPLIFRPNGPPPDDEADTQE